MPSLNPFHFPSTLRNYSPKPLLPPSVDWVWVSVSSETSFGGGACVCICIYTHIHPRAPRGIKAPFTQSQEVHRKQVLGTADHSHSGFGGPLFAVRINLGLLQRPKLGSHLRSEALTFKKLQSK